MMNINRIKIFIFFKTVKFKKINKNSIKIDEYMNQVNTKFNFDFIKIVHGVIEITKFAFITKSVMKEVVKKKMMCFKNAFENSGRTIRFIFNI